MKKIEGSVYNMSIGSNLDGDLLDKSSNSNKKSKPSRQSKNGPADFIRLKTTKQAHFEEEFHPVETQSLE